MAKNKKGQAPQESGVARWNASEGRIGYGTEAPEITLEATPERKRPPLGIDARRSRSGLRCLRDCLHTTWHLHQSGSRYQGRRLRHSDGLEV
jgi:hypothetical protein